MTDIDGAHRRTLTAFGVAQMSHNPAGIGNECTHWIYSALLEARALDYDQALHISQNQVPYTWGRPVAATSAQPGDIAQFHSFQNTFTAVRFDSSGVNWVTQPKIRGPNHTGMVFIAPSGGSYFQLESHIHEAGETVMHIRGNTIFYEPFAVALSAAELARVRGTSAWPASVDQSDMDDLMSRVDWVSLRVSYGIPVNDADKLVPRMKASPNSSIEYQGKSLAWLLVVHATGDLRFYCPQASSARLGMNAAQLAAEKASLIKTCIRGGRPGGKVNADQYGGDNKSFRKDHQYFDWTYTP